MEKIRAVKSKYQEKWLAMPQVEAIGIGLNQGEPAIMITCLPPASAVRDKIPAEIDGVRIVVTEGGPFVAQ